MPQQKMLTGVFAEPFALETVRQLLFSSRIEVIGMLPDSTENIVEQLTEEEIVEIDQWAQLTTGMILGLFREHCYTLGRPDAVAPRAFTITFATPLLESVAIMELEGVLTMLAYCSYCDLPRLPDFLKSLIERVFTVCPIREAGAKKLVKVLDGDYIRFLEEEPYEEARELLMETCPHLSKIELEFATGFFNKAVKFWDNVQMERMSSNLGLAHPPEE